MPNNPTHRFRTDWLEIHLNDAARIVAIQDLLNDRELLAEEAPLLQMVVEGEAAAPVRMEQGEDGRRRLVYPHTEVTLSIREQPTHLSFGIEAIHGRLPMIAMWGPIPCTLTETVGETVGVVQDDTYALGIQALNFHTNGGYPAELPELGVGDADHAATTSGDAALLQAYSRGRDGGVSGSRIAIFGAPPQRALETIGEIEVAEGLPHPMLDGEWTKTSLTAKRSYLIAGFGEQNLDELLDYTRRAGFQYLYHGGPFQNWGHFNLSPRDFPDGDESLRRCSERAAQAGVRLGVHMLSNFITTNDPYVTPVPDKRLMKSGWAKLSGDVDVETRELRVDDPAPFRDRGTLGAVVIGQEIVQYGGISELEPWRLVECERGTFGTEATAHAAGSGVGKLIDHPYRVFFPNLELQDEMADQLIELFNHAGLRQISFDGLEGCERTGHGAYAHHRFVQRCYEGWEREVVNDASRLLHYLWHIHTRMNWGEPWGKATREGMPEYRFRNQEYFRRNLFPRMLGWFQLRLASGDVPATSRDDIEWVLAKGAGFDAGFALATGLDALRRNGQTEPILDVVREWETARLSGAFTETQRERLRVPDAEFHLQADPDGGWQLFPVCYSPACVYNEDEHQPGEPVGVTWQFNNPYGSQPILFALQVLPGIGGGDVREIRNPAFEAEGRQVSVPVTLKPHQYLVCDGTGTLQVCDANWNPLQTIQSEEALPYIDAGPVSIRFQCDNSGALPLEVRFKMLGEPELVAAVESPQVTVAPEVGPPSSRLHWLEPQCYYYTFGPNEPTLRIQPGDRVIARTRDARGYDEAMQPIPEEQKQRSPDTLFRESNPLVGPIYVEGAEPGDLLAVHIEKIELTRDSAWSRHIANFGSLTGEAPGRALLLNPPIPEALYDWRLDRTRQVGILKLERSRLQQVEIPLHPFLGSIGVAPAHGRVEMSLAPGEYGGNMDCVETREGTTLYLPVWVRGGYLAYGDVHAAQGDGEICGVALETTAEVTLRIDLIKGVQAAWPRLEDATHIMTAGSTRPLMDCVRVAQVELVHWLVEGCGFDPWEAWQLNSQVGTMRIGNIVDPNYTVVAKFPKRYLPGLKSRRS